MAASDSEMQVRSVLGVSSFLPYTMSWIYRQMSDPSIRPRAVIGRQRENEDLFPFDNLYILKDESYYQRAIKAKLWFWFGRRPIRLRNRVKKSIEQVLVKHVAQLVHVHFGTFAIYFMENCAQLNIPLLVTFHGFDISSALDRWPAYRNAFSRLMKQMKFAIVISEEMKQRIIKMGCPPEKIRVSYLGIPTGEFPFCDRSHHSGPVKFLHAGRLTAKKGVPDLIRTFKAAFPVEGIAELWIAGDGEEKESVLAAWRESGTPSYIKVFGMQSNDELMKMRREADVFVLNCRTDSAGTKEGLPISTLEAASTGLPAVSTYHAGIPESVIHEETGILVNEFDNQGLARALSRLTDKELRIRMGNNARKFMEEKFDLRECNKRLFEIYKEAIST